MRIFTEIFNEYEVFKDAPNAIASIKVATLHPRTSFSFKSSQQNNASDGTIKGLVHIARICPPTNLPARFPTDEKMKIQSVN